MVGGRAGREAAGPQFSGYRTPSDIRHVFDKELASGDADSWFSRGDYDRTCEDRVHLPQPIIPRRLSTWVSSLFARRRVRMAKAWRCGLATQAPGFLMRNGHVLYPLGVGEPAGRAMEPDVVSIAIELARELKRPVQVTVSQSSSQNHDRVSPGALARMTALPGDGGITIAWGMKVVTADGLGGALARLQNADPPRRSSARPRSTAPFHHILFRT